jgi:hypothetical protein
MYHLILPVNLESASRAGSLNLVSNGLNSSEANGTAGTVNSPPVRLGCNRHCTSIVELNVDYKGQLWWGGGSHFIYA